jgi:nucleotide-binding universal stress UspA family protein
VSKESAVSPIRRILVALDASPQSLLALDAAAEMAARLEAELLGLFVEDIGLLRIAEMPAARELLFSTASHSPLSRATMEASLRSQAEQIRMALAAAAERTRVRWSFRIARGVVAAELLLAGAEADLIALGRAGWSAWPSGRLGATARAVTGKFSPVLLVSRQGVLPEARFLIGYDRTPGARGRLRAITKFAGRKSAGFTILVPASNRESEQEMEKEAAALLGDASGRIHYRPYDPTDKAGLLRRLRAEGAAILVVSPRDCCQGFPPLPELLRETELSVLLLDEAGSGTNSK